MKHFLFIFILSVLVLSCEKEIETETPEEETPLEFSNSLEIIELLDQSNIVQISLDTVSELNAYEEFSIVLNEKKVTYVVTNDLGDTISSSDLIIYPEIFNIVMLNADNESIEHSYKSVESEEFYEEDDSLTRIIRVIQTKDYFPINSKAKIKIEYYYNHDKYKIADTLKNLSRTKEYDLNTTKTPFIIPEFVYCQYPLWRQYNFVQDEIDFGFIKTIEKPEFILDHDLYVTIQNIKTEEVLSADIKYDDALGILKYDMPNLENNSIYLVEYKIKDSDKDFHEPNYFKTSLFNTFKEKTDELLANITSSISFISDGYKYYIINFEKNNELFDAYESVNNGYDHVRKIFAKSKLINDMKPKLVFSKINAEKSNLMELGYYLGDENNLSVDRESEYTGWMPVNDLFSFHPSGIYLTDSEIEQKSPMVDEYKLRPRMITYLLKIIYEDVILFIYKSDTELDYREELRKELYLSQYNADYYFDLIYTIPGIDSVTYTKEMLFRPRDAY